VTIEQNLPLVETIFSNYKDILGADFQAYKNHVYRVINLCYAAGPCDAIAQEKIQIAACFHDIGIWTAKTLDYLPPSVVEAARYLRQVDKVAWTTEITGMIEFHHRVKSCDDSISPLVEQFRRADVADFSLGLFKMGFPASLIAELKQNFPNSGFHLRLLQLGSSWFLKNPLNPLPMFRA